MEELDGGSWVCRARFSRISFPRLDTVELSENLLSAEQQWNLNKSSLDLKLKDPRSLSETTSFRPGSNASPSSASTSSNDLDQELKNLNLDSSESKLTTSRKTDTDSRKSNLFLNRNEPRRSRGGNRRSVSPFGSTELSDTFKEENRPHGKRFFSLPLRRHKCQNKSASKDDLVQHATTRATSPSSMEQLKDKKENNSLSSCFYKLK